MKAAVNMAPRDESTRCTVLVVDDTAENRDLLRRHLERKGHRVVTAAGGGEALSTIDAELPDLVLLDIMMPEIDGLEVLRRLRRKYSPGQLPVIMVTALDDRESVVNSLELGANDYVSKPIDFAVLAARSQSQLDRKAAEAEVRDLNENLERRVEMRTVELRRAYDVLKEESRERIRAQGLLREREEMYRTLYDDNPTTFLSVNEHLVLQSVNRYGASLLGYEVDELVGTDAQQLYVEDDRELAGTAILDCFAAIGTTRNWEARMRCKDGKVIWMRATGKCIEMRDRARNTLVVCEDITEARQLSDQLSYEARHDALTGLFNRREFETRLHRAIDGVMESPDLQHALCYVDLDQFKVINDTCGHVGGDELLRQLAKCLKSVLRGGDVVARLGGDEFGILLECCPQEHAGKVAENILEAIRNFRFVWDDSSFSLTASIGVVAIDQNSRDLSEIMLAADTACYAAKDGGRNRIHVYAASDEDLKKRHGEMRWVIKVKRALEKDRFSLFAQPIQSLKEPVDSLHYEILLRLLDDDGELVLPGAFLPAAERFNVSSNVDLWVVKSTLAWLAAHPEHVARLSCCSINLSGQSLGDRLMLNRLLACLGEFPVPADKLCFEVTETAAIANLHNAQEFMSALKDRGCCFALDDFGTGLSSFAYLKNLPVDRIKIDGVFVRDVDTNPVNLAIVQSITGVSRAMGKQTVAEFVENEAIAAKLRDIGVDYGQGFGLGEAVPLEDIGN